MGRILGIMMLFALLTVGARVPADGISGHWTQMAPDPHPSVRQGHTMAYDGGSDRVILFGGGYYTNTWIYLEDTWAYDYDTDTWEEMSPDSYPSKRDGMGMAYDSQSDRVVFFGGHPWWGPYYDDTWAYDYDTDTWKEMSPDTHPSGRTRPSMAYDVDSDVVILFGGRDAGAAGGRLGDTWAYDYDTDTWQQMQPPNAPSARCAYTMAYDADSDCVILFGGHDGSSVLGDTWAYDYDTDTWQQMQPPNAPHARSAHRLAYDADTDRVILFGGHDGVAFLGDTWAYDYNSDTWEEIPAEIHPSGRCFHDMAYDAESDRTVLFGGLPVLNQPVDDTWALELLAGVIEVEIDIKPGSYPNSINLGSHGVVPVAILSSEQFDATQVDPETVELAGSGVAVRGKGNKYLAHEEDVNNDGLLDLVVQVETENLDPGQFQDGYAVLTGLTYSGDEFEGSDEITIVPPG